MLFVYSVHTYVMQCKYTIQISAVPGYVHTKLKEDFVYNSTTLCEYVLVHMYSESFISAYLRNKFLFNLPLELENKNATAYCAELYMYTVHMLLWLPLCKKTV